MVRTFMGHRSATKDVGWLQRHLLSCINVIVAQVVYEEQTQDAYYRIKVSMYDTILNSTLPKNLVYLLGYSHFNLRENLSSLGW